MDNVVHTFVIFDLILWIFVMKSLRSLVPLNRFFRCVTVISIYSI